jgi:hypothetical protein
LLVLGSCTHEPDANVPEESPPSAVVQASRPEGILGNDGSAKPGYSYDGHLGPKPTRAQVQAEVKRSHVADSLGQSNADVVCEFALRLAAKRKLPEITVKAVSGDNVTIGLTRKRTKMGEGIYVYYELRRTANEWRVLNTYTVVE